MFKMLKRSGLRLIKPADLIIPIISLFLIFSHHSEKGTTIHVYSNGKEVFVLPLTRDTTIEVQGKIGKSTIQIKQGRVRMLHSPCPLKLCEKQGFISTTGNEIICVPNRIVIRIEGRRDIDEITE